MKKKDGQGTSDGERMCSQLDFMCGKFFGVALNGCNCSRLSSITSFFRLSLIDFSTPYQHISYDWGLQAAG
jgi:hypothetical protein